MTKEDLEVVLAAVKAAVQKTPVKVYDNDGDEVTFFKEDVVGVTANQDNRKVTYITLADGCSARYAGSDDTLSTVTVFGSEKKWRKLLGFTGICLNESDAE